MRKVADWALKSAVNNDRQPLLLDVGTGTGMKKQTNELLGIVPKLRRPPSFKYIYPLTHHLVTAL